MGSDSEAALSVTTRGDMAKHKVMITGHRPHKLGGYGENPTRSKIEKRLKKLLKKLKKNHTKKLVVISGMALGVDQWWASIALDLEIDVDAYIPFKGQESRWPERAQKHYRDLLKRCRKVKVSCTGGYAGWKMQRRNEDMVAAADACVAVWDGSKSGTGNCVAHIHTKGKPLKIINPND